MQCDYTWACKPVYMSKGSLKLLKVAYADCAAALCAQYAQTTGGNRAAALAQWGLSNGED